MEADAECSARIPSRPERVSVQPHLLACVHDTLVRLKVSPELPQGVDSLVPWEGALSDTVYSLGPSHSSVHC